MSRCMDFKRRLIEENKLDGVIRHIKADEFIERSRKIIFDTGAEISVFCNKLLLQDIEYFDKPIELMAANDTPIMIVAQGIFSFNVGDKVFKQVAVYAPKMEDNLLSPYGFGEQGFEFYCDRYENLEIFHYTNKNESLKFRKVNRAFYSLDTIAADIDEEVEVLDKASNRTPNRS